MKKQFVLTYLLLLFIQMVPAKALFVAPEGDDTVSYESNSVHSPWATPRHAWLYAKAGDTVYFREGTYTVTETINTKYIASHGTEEAPILFTNYENENPVITGDVGGGPIFIVEKNYNHIDGLTIRGGNFSGGSLEGSVIVVGWDIGAQHFKITNSTIEVYQSNTYSNNAAIRINQTSSNFAEVRNCKIIGDGGTIGIQIFRTQGVTISNNEFYNNGCGVYLKHSNALDDDTTLTNRVINNYFHDNSGEAIYGVFNYADIRNNLMVGTGVSLGDDGGVGDGWVGADYNHITHNTLVDCGIEFRYEGREGDPNQGCLHNVIKDNIITDRVIYHNYDDIDADIQSDYNLYPDMENLVAQNRINYTLEEWQSHNQSDANSLQGTPLFVGGSSPQKVAGYALASNSPGKSAASDGGDMGIVADSVSVQDGTPVLIGSTKSVSSLTPLIVRNGVLAFDISEGEHYTINLYSLHGKRVSTIVQSYLRPRRYEIDLGKQQLGHGLYLLTVTSSTGTQSCKLML